MNQIGHVVAMLGMDMARHLESAERERLHGDIWSRHGGDGRHGGGGRGITLSLVQDVALDGLSPLVCLKLRIGHKSVSDTRAEDLEALLLPHHPLCSYHIADVDETLGTVALGDSLLVLVNLQDNSESLATSSSSC